VVSDISSAQCFREPIAARENREADPAKQAGGVIRLRPAVAGVRRDRLITNHSGITDWALV